MTPVQKLAALLVLAVGAGAAVWLAARHYRLLLDTASHDLVNAKAARDNKGMKALRLRCQATPYQLADLSSFWSV